jgi:hypothetical protein
MGVTLVWLSDFELNEISAFFQLLIPGLTPVSLLGSKSGFEIVKQLADIGKRPSSHIL